jgi:hypothetical protein
MEPTGEVKLVCAVIASAIVEEPEDAIRAGRAPYRSGFFDGPVSIWCALIGLDWQFVIEQAERLSAFQRIAEPVSYRGLNYGDATIIETRGGVSFAWRRPNGSVAFMSFDSIGACQTGLRNCVSKYVRKLKAKQAAAKKSAPKDLRNLAAAITSATGGQTNSVRA